ncbi:MAG: hypothetical protein FWG70_02275 [Oscillospiraceae bacterium]|nr:hypothetical protein [Oscillospiraceae bacterium]
MNFFEIVKKPRLKHSVSLPGIGCVLCCRLENRRSRESRVRNCRLMSGLVMGSLGRGKTHERHN